MPRKIPRRRDFGQTNASEADQLELAMHQVKTMDTAGFTPSQMKEHAETVKLHEHLLAGMRAAGLRV